MIITMPYPDTFHMMQLSVWPTWVVHDSQSLYRLSDWGTWLTWSTLENHSIDVIIYQSEPPLISHRYIRNTWWHWIDLYSLINRTCYSACHSWSDFWEGEVEKNKGQQSGKSLHPAINMIIDWCKWYPQVLVDISYVLMNLA